jgi:hypothetical protein
MRIELEDFLFHPKELEILLAGKGEISRILGREVK